MTVECIKIAMEYENASARQKILCAEIVLVQLLMLKLMEIMTLNGDVIQKGTKFSYLGDVLSSEGEMQEAITAIIRSGWEKFEDIASVLL